MRYRHKLSRRRSKRVFSRTSRSRRRNYAHSSMRGGIRL